MKPQQTKERKAKPSKEKKELDFIKRNKVSVWASQHPYEEIPDAYFEEQFSHKQSRATNTWTRNFKLPYFDPEDLETNGAQKGRVMIKKAAGQCSYSSSYIEVLMSKARKKKMEEVTWIVLLFDCEYSPKLSSVAKDEYLTFLGAFNYDPDAESLYEVD